MSAGGKGHAQRPTNHNAYSQGWDLLYGGSTPQPVTPSDADVVQELELENRMLRARNERLQFIVDGIVPRLEAACGASSMPPNVARKFIDTFN